MFSDRVRSRLLHIVENADWISDDLSGCGWEEFVADRRRGDAVERCLQRITEAVIQLGEVPSAELGLAVPWNELRTLGNRLRHEYHRVDQRIICEIAVNDEPALREAAQRALDAS